MKQLNKEVSDFLEVLNHPLIKEIQLLREIILQADKSLSENIKWNGPNYLSNGADRITMKIQPPKNIQLIFHRGAKVKAQPQDRLIKDESGLLAWKENDRAVATFKNLTDVEGAEKTLTDIVKKWIAATS
jgi:hypothetical protein